MSASVTLLSAIVVGVVIGTLLAPLTRRELTASLRRVAVGCPPTSAIIEPGEREMDAPRISPRQRVILAIASGFIPASILFRLGWSAGLVPPLILLMGLIQLAYCDLTHRLLPRTLVRALTLAVIASGVLVAGALNEWPRLIVGGFGAAALFVLLFGFNLANPSWLAFGDVRLSFVVGFGMAWVSPMALLECVCIANLLAAAVGLVLIAAHRAERSSGMPFGLYLAIGVVLVLATSHI